MSEHACKQGDAQCVWCMYRESARQLTEAREKLEAAERELRGAKASNDHHRAEADRLQAALSEARSALEALFQYHWVRFPDFDSVDHIASEHARLLKNARAALAKLPRGGEAAVSPGVALAQVIPPDEEADKVLGELFRKYKSAPPARAEGGCEVNCPCHMYGGTYSPTHCGACG